MHIIKKAEATKALGQHVRGGEREEEREREGARGREKHMTTTASSCQFSSQAEAKPPWV